MNVKDHRNVIHEEDGSKLGPHVTLCDKFVDEDWDYVLFQDVNCLDCILEAELRS